MRAALDRAMEQIGYHLPDLDSRVELESVQVWLYRRLDGGSWVIVAPRAGSPPPVAGSLARELGEDLDVFEVVGTDRVVRLPDGEDGFSFDVRVSRVSPDGRVSDSPLEDGTDLSGPQVARGDFDETADSVVFDLLEGPLAPEARSLERLRYVLAPNVELGDRLRGILANCREAKAITLEHLDGQLFLRLSFAASSRLARISKDELDTLRRAGARVPVP